MRVLKFGGKSLGSLEKCTEICKFIKKVYKSEKEIVVVVSAIGITTDSLSNLAFDYGYEKSLNKSTEISKREMAKLLSTGEIQSAALFSLCLNSMGVPAKSLSASDLEISTFGDYLNSKVAYINKSKIEEVLKNKTVAVVAGFQGINKSGDITTLGRGGSDTTAVAIASIFDCEAEIYSDYNGVFAGDPKLASYKKLKNINYDTTHLMANAGAKVIDERANAIAKNFNTTIISKSSSHPNLKGTIISNIESDTISIQSLDNLCKVTIIFSNDEKFAMIFKNVINCLKNYKIYNLNYSNHKLELVINSSDKTSITAKISKTLNLLQNK